MAASRAEAPRSTCTHGTARPNTTKLPQSAPFSSPSVMNPTSPITANVSPADTGLGLDRSLGRFCTIKVGDLALEAGSRLSSVVGRDVPTKNGLGRSSFQDTRSAELESAANTQGTEADEAFAYERLGAGFVHNASLTRPISNFGSTHRREADEQNSNHGAANRLPYLSGSSFMLRNSIGAPSDWRQMWPSLTVTPVARFCSTPLTHTVTVSPAQIMS